MKRKRLLCFTCTYWDSVYCCHGNPSPTDPVAGACATTSNLLYDAQLTLTHTDLSTTFTFFSGDLGYGARGLPFCDYPSPAPIQDLVYYGYLYFLPERSYSEDAMFEGIRQMLTTESVLKNGQPVRVEGREGEGRGGEGRGGEGQSEGRWRE